MAGALLSTPQQRLDALARCKTIAVVGLQDNPQRPAYGVARVLQARGIKIYPVHPAGGETLGEPILRHLADLPVRVDMVDVFRNPVHLPALLVEVLALPAEKQPWLLWFQDGVIHEETAQRAVAAGYSVVMDDCTARRSMQLP